MFRVLFTLCLVYSVAFIFGNSLQVGDVSSDRSEQVRQLINQVLGFVGLGPVSLHFVRKLAHFAEFMIMGFWFMLCLRVYTRHYIRHISWPLFLGLTTAAVDETIQMFVKGRGSSLKDVWIDFSGFVTGLFVALCLLMFVQMCWILYKHRNDDKPRPRVKQPPMDEIAPVEEEESDQWQEWEDSTQEDEDYGTHLRY